MRFEIQGSQELSTVTEEDQELFQASAPWEFSKGNPDAALEIFDDWGRKRTATPPPGEELDEFGYDSDDVDCAMDELAPLAVAEPEPAQQDGLMLPDRARLCSKMMAGLERALDSGALQNVFREIHDEDVAENRGFHRQANRSLFGALEQALDNGALERLLAEALAEEEAPAANSFVLSLADLPGAVNTDALEVALRSLATQEDEEDN